MMIDPPSAPFSVSPTATAAPAINISSVFGKTRDALKLASEHARRASIYMLHEQAGGTYYPSTSQVEQALRLFVEAQQGIDMLKHVNYSGSVNDAVRGFLRMADRDVSQRLITGLEELIQRAPRQRTSEDRTLVLEAQARAQQAYVRINHARHRVFDGATT